MSNDNLPAWATTPRGLPHALLDRFGNAWISELSGDYFWGDHLLDAEALERDFGPCTPLWPDSPNETRWTRGDSSEALLRLLERARRDRVEVAVVISGERFTGIPTVDGEWLLLDSGLHVYLPRASASVVYVSTPLPPEPEHPSWLPDDAEDGDLLCSGSDLARCMNGVVTWLNGSRVDSPDYYDWSVWSPWADLKRERDEALARAEAAEGVQAR